MSSFYKTIVPAGAAIGLGWGVGRYGAAGIIASMLAGGLFGAFIGDRMIAGVVNFIINSEVVLAFYISHNEEEKDKRPVNLLFYSIFEWAIKSNYKIYDFGIFTVNENPNMGLGRFKENFGASGIFRDTIEFKF